MYSENNRDSKMKGYSYPLVFGFLTIFAIHAHASIHSGSVDFDIDNPVVVSPVRMKQPLADVPAAVTIITREQIQRYGIKSVLDALRLVPGFDIDYRANEAQVYSHAGNTVPRRLNVMLDGVTYFRPAFTSVDWEALPVSIEDIDRIEVTRAPSAATYGSNSFSAVVNIISLHPVKAGSAVSTTYSSHDDSRTFGRYTFVGANTAVRASAEYDKATGFDQVEGQNDRAGYYFGKFNLRSVTDVSASDQVEILGSVTKGKRQVLSVENHQTSYPDIGVKDISLSTQWTHTLTENQLKAHLNYFHGNRPQEWGTCQIAATFLPEASTLWLIDPDYVLALLSGQTPHGGGPKADAALQALLTRMAQYGPGATSNICTDTSQSYSETSADAELQDTWQPSDTFRMVGAVNYRYDSADSKDYLNGKASRDSIGAALNAEWKTQWTTLNVGDYLENDHYSGANNAPRAVLNIHLSPDHTLRVGWTESFKTPELRATDADWRYYGTNAQPLFLGSSNVVFYLHALAPDSLEPERVIEREIGYLGQLHSIGTTVNVRYFEDSYYHLVSEEYTIYKFDLTNNGSSRQKGAELDTNTVLGSEWLLNTGLSYVDVDANNLYEYDNYAQLSGFVAVSYRFSPQWDSGIAYHATKYGNGIDAFKELDWTVNFQPSMFHQHLRLQGSLNYYPANRFDYASHPQISSQFTDTSLLQQSYDAKLIGFLNAAWKF